MKRDAFPNLHPDNSKIALVEGESTFTYSEVDRLATLFASGLLSGVTDLNEERIAFFLPASINYVTAMHGVWRAGGIAVPLNVASAVMELEHYLSCASVTRLIANPESHEALAPLCQELDIKLLSVDEVMATTAAALPEIPEDRRAMMLFTSGTTNKPKGVVSTHKTIRHRLQPDRSLGMEQRGCHSAISATASYSRYCEYPQLRLMGRGTVHLFAKFDIPRITEQVASGTYNIFMAVPTIYVKLIQYFDSIKQEQVRSICDGFNAMRLISLARQPARLNYSINGRS